jgi:hypothetical protein
MIRPILPYFKATEYWKIQPIEKIKKPPKNLQSKKENYPEFKDPGTYNKKGQTSKTFQKQTREEPQM